VCLRDPVAQPRHRAAHGRVRAPRGERVEVLLARQLHVDAHTVRPPPGLGDQLRTRLGDHLEVDIARELVLAPECARDGDELLHGRIGAAVDGRAQKEPVDEPAAVVVAREPDDLMHREPRALDVVRPAQRAVRAVVDAVVAEEELEERNPAPVRRDGVVNRGRLDVGAVERGQRVPRRPARGRIRPGGARRVETRGVGEDGEAAADRRSGKAGHTEYTPNTSRRSSRRAASGPLVSSR